MMLFVAQTSRRPEFEFNRPVNQAVKEAEYAGKKEPSQEALCEFSFEQRVIPLEGGQHSLKLRKPLVLRINRDTLRFVVKDWGVELDCVELSRLPRELARRFLMLLNAAENECLGEADQADWLRISDYIDYQQFTIDRSAPRYVEGTLRRNADLVLVEWHDGKSERLDHRLGRALSELDAGERFSAFAKLGRDSKTIALERVSLLRKPGDREDWESWPQKG